MPRVAHAGFKRSGHGRTWQKIRRLPELRALVIAENVNPIIAWLSPAGSTEKPVPRLLAGQAHLRRHWPTRTARTITADARAAAAVVEARRREIAADSGTYR